MLRDCKLNQARQGNFYNAAIVGLAGPSLLPAEAALLRRFQPAGLILFARNIDTPEQLAALITEIRAAAPRARLMVDQEGGRVARLRPPHWRAHPAARQIGDLPMPTANRAAWLTGALIGLDCASAGFDVVAAPVLDVGGAHEVIGDRAFADDPARVAALGRQMAKGLLAAGLQPVIKHAPGHGRARADSHRELPVLDNIAATDLVPFAANADLPWMMTAHIRYSSRDMRPATQSAAIIESVIRGELGFAGVLVTDDLAMQALAGSPGERAAAALAAGCDIALHGSGVLEESEDVLRHAGPMPRETAVRLQRAAAMAAAHRTPLDAAALAAERDRLLA